MWIINNNNNNNNNNDNNNNSNNNINNDNNNLDLTFLIPRMKGSIIDRNSIGMSFVNLIY